jgi:hypothetical protein
MSSRLGGGGGGGGACSNSDRGTLGEKWVAEALRKAWRTTHVESVAERKESTDIWCFPCGDVERGGLLAVEVK